MTTMLQHMGGAQYVYLTGSHDLRRAGRVVHLNDIVGGAIDVFLPYDDDFTPLKPGGPHFIIHNDGTAVVRIRAKKTGASASTLVNLSPGDAAWFFTIDNQDSLNDWRHISL